MAANTMAGELEDWSIARKELLPIVLATGYSREPNLMHLLRCVFLVAAFNELSLRPMWIPGSTNKVTDAISRNNMAIFWLQAPKARPAPVELSPVLMDLLIKYLILTLHRLLSLI